jgi:nucleoside-diphosphate-sugar epimerase
MPKIAILGANGQVGAELCVLLSQVASVDLVPVCRNRTGSAFLRWTGIRCRHGRPASAEDAGFLLADCDVVLNSALASGSPADMRRTEDAIVRNAFRYSRPGATVIHFSTQSVYGDARPGKLMRWRSLYGRAKLATERRVRSEAKRSGKSAYVLRLGHVGGMLQEISNNIRREIREDRVLLPEIDVPSNLVYTMTIVDALLAIIRGDVAPGCYDLMNVPQWTWRAVYEFEAASSGHELHPSIVPVARSNSNLLSAARAATRAVSNIAAGSGVRQLVGSALAHLPPSVSARGQAWWYCKRARNELAALEISRSPAEHLSWVPNGTRFIPKLQRTADLLAADPYRAVSRPRNVPWAEDLPSAESDSPLVASVRERTS